MAAHCDRRPAAVGLTSASRSHSVSVIAVQTGSMRRRLRHEPPADAEELSGIELTARQALAGMRRMLGLLRAADAGMSLSPQPGMDQIERLVEQLREAGLEVALRREGAHGRLRLASTWRHTASSRRR